MAIPNSKAGVEEKTSLCQSIAREQKTAGKACHRLNGAAHKTWE